VKNEEMPSADAKTDGAEGTEGKDAEMPASDAPAAAAEA